MIKIRKPAVAGTFYPDDPKQLKLMLADYLNDALQNQKVPKAIIAPHAGYIYSGPIAASVYVRLIGAKSLIKRVLLIGSSHRVSFNGIALSSVDQFSTPLGNIEIDKDGIKQLESFSFIKYIDQAHEKEHSLEMHLPFLQTVLNKFSILPLVAGNATAEQVSQVVELFWEKRDTLIVISTDLSHFHDYETAQKMDQATSKIIEELQYEKLDSESTCARIPVSGLLAFARKKNLRVKAVDIRNSGDTAGSGDKNRVVGYGAYVIE